MISLSGWFWDTRSVLLNTSKMVSLIGRMLDHTETSFTHLKDGVSYALVLGHKESSFKHLNDGLSQGLMLGHKEFI